MMTNMMLSNGKDAYVIQKMENGYKIYPLNTGSKYCIATIVDNGSCITSAIRQPDNKFQIFIKKPDNKELFCHTLPLERYKDTKKAWYFWEKAPISIEINEKRLFNVRPSRLTPDNKWIDQVIFTIASPGSIFELPAACVTVCPNKVLDFKTHGTPAGYEIT